MKGCTIALLAILFLACVVELVVATPNGISHDYQGVFGNNRTDSLNMSFVGNWPFGRSFSVAYDQAREIAFISSGGGAVVLDVSDPLQPVEISDMVRSKGRMWWMCFESGFQRLYAACGSAGVEIWDISNPSTPSKLGLCDTGGSGAYDVFALGDYAYVGVVPDGFKVFDVSNPTNPQVVGSVNYAPHGVWQIAVADSFAHVLTSGSEFHIINISDPQNPLRVGVFRLDPPWDWIKGIDAFGDYVYISGEHDSSFVKIVDVSIPSNPVEVGSYESSLIGMANGLHVSYPYAYVSHGGFLILDISDPTDPQFVSRTSIYSYDIVVYDTLAYFAGYSGYRDGLLIMDVADPQDPVLLSNYDTYNYSEDVFVSGNYAYLASEEELIIIDVSDPQLPSKVGICDMGSERLHTYVVDTLAYVTYAQQVNDGGIQVVNVSDPSNPVIIGSEDDYCYPWGIFVEGSFAYIADGLLWITDISDPTNPQKISFYDPIGDVTFYEVHVIDSLAYLAGSGGFWILDVSSVLYPQLLGSCEPGAVAYGMDVAYPFAYLTCYSNFKVIDIFDSANPHEVGSCSVLGPSGECSVEYPYVYITNGDFVRVIDVSDPANPIDVGYYQVPQGAQDAFYQDPYVYVSDEVCGLQIYEFTSAHVLEEEEKVIPYWDFSLLANPVHGDHIELSVKCTSNEAIAFGLYNALGQLVESYRLNVQYGKIVRLDIKNVLSGVYFLRLERNQLDYCEKVVIVR